MASAAILVGGQSRRLGGIDKSAIQVGGRSIFDRQIAEVEQITDDILVVGGGAPGVRAGLRVIPDRVPNSGPLGGLDAALAAARDAQLVLIACDMPFVTAALLAYLLELAHTADAVVPRTKHGYHPLCAAYTRACRAPVMHRLEERRLALHELFEDVHVRVVEGSELERFGEAQRLLANVNTPAELRGLEALLGQQG
jgi:molybdopterin-guanine dinucleotide biosynthesis protein A